ncbi:MAG: hypothetical protein K2Q97_16365 [Burkholderiaceae bacterium]|nr:hypothetical protein [Burkholderiaceae bacterium]
MPNAVQYYRAALASQCHTTLQWVQPVPAPVFDSVMVGGDWKGAPRWQRLTPALAERGIRVSFAPHTHGISSTAIVTKIRTEALALHPPVAARPGR